MLQVAGCADEGVTIDAFHMCFCPITSQAHDVRHPRGVEARGVPHDGVEMDADSRSPLDR
jgi:hypothetical protein